MLMEYVYKLNLPPLSEVVLPHLLDTLFAPTDKQIYTHYKSSEIFLPEWTNIHGMFWEKAYYFHKTNGRVGEIHIDSVLSNEYGINWVLDGNARLEYWNLEDLPDVEPSHNMKKSTMYKKFQTERSPIKTYDMNAGAYLVNACVPHRPSGWGNRHVISLRSSENNQRSWQEVIKLFNDLIIQ